MEIESCRHANQGMCNGCPAKRMSKTIRQVDFQVPIRTVSEMNNRDHWAVRLKRKHAQQLELMAAWQNNIGGRKIELPCVVKLTRVGPKNLDGDNLQGGMKFLRDAVVEAAQRWRRAQGEALNVMEVDGMRPVVTRTWYLLRRTVEDLNKFEASLKDQEHASK